MVFVDGENLLLRYEAMLALGRAPRGRPQSYYDPEVTTYQPKRFVWNADIPSQLQDGPLIRVTYYTTAVGSPQDIETLEDELARLQSNIELSGGGVRKGVTNLVPRVFKKQKSGSKTKSVDINICVDMLQQAYQSGADDLLLVSGDGDYVPLVKAVMAAGKRVYIAALSSGLAPPMKRVADRFIDLDSVMFMP